MTLVYVVCRNKSEAKKIARVILQKRLASCANVFPVSSLYWWHKKLVTGHETVLLLKTNRQQFTFIEKEILKIHQYDTPAIFSLSVGQVNKKYKQWLNRNLKK